MNTIDVIFLPNWPQFNAATIGLRVLHQVLTSMQVFTKPPPFGKRLTIVKVPWLLNYWVIDKDTPMKVAPTCHVKSMVSSLEVSNDNNKSDIVFQWLLTAATLTIMDPNQPKPLIKLPIYIEHDLLQYHISV